jgi:hypothetical protein
LWISYQVECLIPLWLYCRSSTNYISLQCLAQNKEAAKLLMFSESWPRPATKASTPCARQLSVGVHLEIELMKPITKAITVVEGNNPMLSSMVPLWKPM